MAWNGHGYNQDGVEIEPRLTLNDGTTVVACNDDLIDEAESFQPRAMVEHLAKYRVETMERLANYST
eukprot:12419766-Karenia_brevis.AAC.1